MITLLACIRAPFTSGIAQAQLLCCPGRIHEMHAEGIQELIMQCLIQNENPRSSNQGSRMQSQRKEKMFVHRDEHPYKELSCETPTIGCHEFVGEGQTSSEKRNPQRVIKHIKPHIR